MSDLPAPVDQPTPRPTPKWIAGVSTGGATILVLELARTFGLDLPPAAGEALVVAAGGFAAWLKRNRGTILDVLDRSGGGHHDLDGDGIADGTQRR